MAEEAGDDDLGDVRRVRTAAGHTHHSEEEEVKMDNSISGVEEKE